MHRPRCALTNLVWIAVLAPLAGCELGAEHRTLLPTEAFFAPAGLDGEPQGVTLASQSPSAPAGLLAIAPAKLPPSADQSSAGGSVPSNNAADSAGLVSPGVSPAGSG